MWTGRWGLGSHLLSHSSSVPNKPYGFCGRKKKKKKKTWRKKMGLAPRGQELCKQQTPSNGLRHPSFGGRCRKAMLGVCVNREVGLCSLSFPIPFLPPSLISPKPCGFCGRKAPPQVKMGLAPRGQELCEEGGGPVLLSFPIPFFPRPELINHAVSVDVKTPRKRHRQELCGEGASGCGFCGRVRSCVEREVGLGPRVFNSYPIPPHVPNW